MSELKFSDLSVSIDDLPTRPQALSEEDAADVLGGAGWYRPTYYRSSRRSSRSRFAGSRYSSRRIPRGVRSAYYQQAQARAARSRARSHRNKYAARASYYARLNAMRKRYRGRR